MSRQRRDFLFMQRPNRDKFIRVIFSSFTSVIREIPQSKNLRYCLKKIALANWVEEFTRTE